MADDVTVTDSSGVLLSGGGATGAASVEQGRRLEASLIDSAQTMLDKVLGPGLSTVSVNADLDFDQRSTKTQQYQYPEECQRSTVKQRRRRTRQRITAPATALFLEIRRRSLVKALQPTPSRLREDHFDKTNPIDSTITERVGCSWRYPSLDCRGTGGYRGSRRNLWRG